MPKQKVKKKKPATTKKSVKKGTMKKKVGKRPENKRPPGAARYAKSGKKGSTGPRGVNWAIWREKYVTTVDKITYLELSRLIGVNEATVERRAAKEKWGDQRKDYFTEITRQWKDICKNEINAVKLESLRAIRATKTVLLKKLSQGLIRTATVADLLNLIKQELALLDPSTGADLTIHHSVDENKLREVLKTAIETGQIDRTALRKAARNS